MRWISANNLCAIPIDFVHLFLFFTQGEVFGRDIIGIDYRKTGKCDLAIAKEMLFQVLGSGFLLQKDTSRKRKYHDLVGGIFI